MNTEIVWRCRLTNYYVSQRFLWGKMKYTTPLKKAGGEMCSHFISGVFIKLL